MEGFDIKAAGAIPRRLFPYTLGFLNPRLRRILALAGHELHVGLPGPEDGVVVWGRSRHAWRGETVAVRRAVPLVRVEDAFLRSLRPGRMGDAPMGLLLDPSGVHFDASVPSLVEKILASAPLDNSYLLSRSKEAIARIQALHLSKYNIHDPDLPAPPAGYVLVIDQTRGDASIPQPGRFAEMLALAQEEHPAARIVIKTHPETYTGLRPGHFGTGEGRVTRCDQPISPWRLLEGAIAVYTVSSQLGFEAILAGHRPVVFGQPFYAGWGLSDDRFPVARRTRRLTRAQLFAGAMILAPTWYDSCRDRLCEVEDVINQLEAETRAFRADRAGYVAGGMRLWKRARLQAFFGQQNPLIFRDAPEDAAALAVKTHRKPLIWASKAPATLTCTRVEDGFLRSRGLGASLVPPISLVTDRTGIYYDPTRPCDLEALIRAPQPPGAEARAAALRLLLVQNGLSKYNLAGALPDLPQGHRILVPGQVEDDASIRLGCDAIRTNLALLQAARDAHPDAILIYKPHPDVEAGLRPGVLDDADLTAPIPDPVARSNAAESRPSTMKPLADLIARNTDPIALIDACDEVWTMTSLLGFEALLRGKPVTCLGVPFYAGYGLTRDLGPVPDRRRSAEDGHPYPRLMLDQLIHAALIAYPRYYDPVSRRPCPPEVAAERLAAATLPRPSLTLRFLAKLQGAFASQSHLWR